MTGNWGSNSNGAHANGHGAATNGNGNGNGGGEGASLTELASSRGRIVGRPEPLGTAIVGYGYWGPNLARNIAESTQLRLDALCDHDDSQRRVFRQRHPDARAVRELDALLADPAI